MPLVAQNSSDIDELPFAVVWERASACAIAVHARPLTEYRVCAAPSCQRKRGSYIPRTEPA